MAPTLKEETSSGCQQQLHSHHPHVATPLTKPPSSRSHHSAVSVVQSQPWVDWEIDIIFTRAGDHRSDHQHAPLSLHMDCPQGNRVSGLLCKWHETEQHPLVASPQIVYNGGGPEAAHLFPALWASLSSCLSVVFCFRLLYVASIDILSIPHLCIWILQWASDVLLEGSSHTTEEQGVKGRPLVWLW